jgi:hypothetical protein
MIDLSVLCRQLRKAGAGRDMYFFRGIALCMGSCTSARPGAGDTRWHGQAGKHAVMRFTYRAVALITEATSLSALCPSRFP